MILQSHHLVDSEIGDKSVRDVLIDLVVDNKLSATEVGLLLTAVQVYPAHTPESRAAKESLLYKLQGDF